MKPRGVLARRLPTGALLLKLRLRLRLGRGQVIHLGLELRAARLNLVPRLGQFRDFLLKPRGLLIRLGLGGGHLLNLCLEPVALGFALRERGARFGGLRFELSGGLLGLGSAGGLGLKLRVGLLQRVGLLPGLIFERLAAGARFLGGAARLGQVALHRAAGLAEAVQFGGLLPKLFAGLRQLVGERLQPRFERRARGQRFFLRAGGFGELLP